MRIVYIHQYFNTRHDAGGTRSYEFARRWVAAGHHVTLITSMRRPAQGARRFFTEQDVDGIRVLAVHVPYSNYMSFGRRMVAFLAFMFGSIWAGLRYGGRADVVLATSTPLTVGIPGVILSWWRHAAFVFEIRDLWPEAPIQLGALRNPLAIAVARGLERCLYRVARHVVTLSPGMEAALLAMGVPAAKLSMFPNCSDLDLFQPSAADPAVAERYDLAGRFVVAYTGAMGPANGLDVVIETARVIQERAAQTRGAEDVCLVLVGDGRERPGLEARARALGLNNVRFLDRIPKEDLPRFLALSDAILTIFAPYPVLETCSPNKLFDGLAMGRPVVINFGGWMQTLLEESGAGLAVPSNRPEELADALLGLRADPERRAAMGRAARSLAADRFDRDRIAAEYEALLRRVSGS